MTPLCAYGLAAAPVTIMQLSTMLPNAAHVLIDGVKWDKNAAADAILENEGWLTGYLVRGKVQVVYK